MYFVGFHAGRALLNSSMCKAERTHFSVLLLATLWCFQSVISVIHVKWVEGNSQQNNITKYFFFRWSFHHQPFTNTSNGRPLPLEFECPGLTLQLGSFLSSVSLPQWPFSIKGIHFLDAIHVAQLFVFSNTFGVSSNGSKSDFSML